MQTPLKRGKNKSQDLPTPPINFSSDPQKAQKLSILSIILDRSIKVDKVIQLNKLLGNKNWKNALYIYYATPAEKIFPCFKLGVVIFFWGLVLMYSANQLLKPSLSQEIVTLVGLLLIGGGFLYAMTAQVRMLIGRFVKEFSKKRDFS